MNRRRKFNNVPTVVDGIRFDSKKEARRWGELLALHKAGRITALQRQVRIPIRLNGELICKYIADFVYVEGGERVIEDAKGFVTREYILKRKLLRAVYGIIIRES